MGLCIPRSWWVTPGRCSAKGHRPGLLLWCCVLLPHYLHSPEVLSFNEREGSATSVSRPRNGVLAGPEEAGGGLREAGCGALVAEPGKGSGPASDRLNGVPGCAVRFSEGTPGLVIDFLASNYFSVSGEGGMECNSAH